MYKDPTKFRKRFQSYKNGKMPYKNGRPIEDEEYKLPKFGGGKEPIEEEDGTQPRPRPAKHNRFEDMSVEQLEQSYIDTQKYWEDQQQKVSSRTEKDIHQMGVEANKKYVQQHPYGGDSDQALQKTHSLVINTMQNQIPFSGKDYATAINNQRQDKLDLWHDYKKGIKATAKAAELILSGGSLLGAYANWKNWKDLANVANATASQLTKARIANILQKAQLPMQLGGTAIDGYQTYDAIQNNNAFETWWNGISAVMGAAGSIGAADLFNSARMSYPYIDRVLDTTGVIQSSGDFIKSGAEYFLNNKDEE